jgi:hypothetical protein
VTSFETVQIHEAKDDEKKLAAIGIVIKWPLDRNHLRYRFSLRLVNGLRSETEDLAAEVKNCKTARVRRSVRRHCGSLCEGCLVWT